MRTMRYLMAAALLTAVTAGGAQAQQSEVERLRRELDEMRGRLDRLEGGPPDATGPSRDPVGGEPRDPLAPDSPGGANSPGPPEGEGEPVVPLPGEGPPPAALGPAPEEQPKLTPVQVFWEYAQENLRLSINLNNFFIARDHSRVSANGPRGDVNAFTVGQFELDLWTEHRHGIDFRVDLDFAEDDDAQPHGTTFAYPDEFELEQGFLQFDLKKIAGIAPVKLLFGKFNSPMGFEPIDAPGLLQFSRSNIASFFTPNNFVGAMAKVETEIVDLEAFIGNGWNTNDDPDREKTGGGRIRLKLIDTGKFHVVTIAPAANYGHEPTSLRAGGRRFVFDLVTVVQPIENLKLAFETNWGHEDDTIERAPLVGGPVGGAGRTYWQSYMGVANLRLTKWFAFTLRGEYIKDHDGFQTGLVRAIGRSTPHHLKSGTVALNLKVPVAPDEVFEHMYINVEWRYDRSNKKIFTRSGTSITGETEHSSTFAFQVFYYF